MVNCIMGSQELSVNWNAHSSALVSEFQKLFLNKSLVDCTVAAEGQYLRVHKVVLSACSPYFQILLNEESEKHPIIILRDVKFEDLKRIIEFVYHGEVKLPEEKLFEFLSVAESLQIKGLGDKSNEAFGKRPIVDLLSKKRPEILSSSEHILNQSSSSGNVIEKSISCVKLSSSQNSNSQPQIQQPFTNSIDIPSSSRSPSSSSNVITAIVRNNNRGSAFSCSETKPFQDNVEHLPPFSISDVKEEIIIDDDDDDDEDEEDIVTKEEYSYDEIGNEFLEESYDIDTGNQDVKPSTSQQYTVPKNVSAETQVGELNRVEGFAACYDEVVPPGLPSHANADVMQQYSTNGSDPERNLSSVHLPQSFGDFIDEVILPDSSPRTEVEELQLYSTFNSTSEVPTSQHPSSVADALGTVTVHNLDGPKKYSKTKHLACDLCHCIFADYRDLQNHLRLHTAQKTYKCSGCTRVFHDIHVLRRHMRTHSEEKPFKCVVCSRMFRKVAHLREHMRIHSGVKPFKCNVCQSTFRRKCHLNEHLRIHTGEKPLKCDMCNMSFRFYAQLKIHKRSHTGEKPYVCDVCGVAFSQLYFLKTHYHIHSASNAI